VRVATRYAAQLQPITYACGAQRALLPIAVGAMNINKLMNINVVHESATIFARPCKLTFDLLTLKEVSESRVTWATCVPILVFLGISVLELFPMYATDRQTDVRQTDRQTDRQTNVRQRHRLMPPPRGRGIIIFQLPDVWVDPSGCAHDHLFSNDNDNIEQLNLA